MPAPHVRSSLIHGAALLSAVLLLGSVRPAAAITMKECGTNYQAAKTAGTLKGQDWNAFRTANCAATPAAATTAPAPATTAPVPVTTTTHDAVAAGPGKVAPPPAGSAVFPDKIAPKYASLKAGTARRKTCDDQYKLNKANAGNAGLPWNQKGGGYYSACNKHLKGV
jgi:hypothetical protein